MPFMHLLSDRPDHPLCVVKYNHMINIDTKQTGVLLVVQGQFYLDNKYTKFKKERQIERERERERRRRRRRGTPNTHPYTLKLYRTLLLYYFFI